MNLPRRSIAHRQANLEDGTWAHDPNLPQNFLLIRKSPTCLEGMDHRRPRNFEWSSWAGISWQFATFTGSASWLAVVAPLMCLTPHPNTLEILQALGRHQLLVLVGLDRGEDVCDGSCDQGRLKECESERRCRAEKQPSARLDHSRSWRWVGEQTSPNKCRPCGWQRSFSSEPVRLCLR